MIHTLIRGLLLLIAGLFPVFRVGIESLTFGSWVLIVFWFAYAVFFLISAFKRQGDFRETLNSSLISFVSLLAAIALVLEVTVVESNLLFQITIIVWAAITGINEFLWGISKKLSARTTVGALGILLFLAVTLVPADFYIEFVPEKAPPGWLDAPTMHIGLFGAYAVIAGVYLIITALSSKFGSAENE